MTAVTACHLKAGLLVDHHPAIGCQILHIDGAFPIHVQVGGHLAAPAQDAVLSVHIAANPVVIEVARVCGHSHDGQIILPVLIDVGACSHPAGQKAVGKQA